MQFEDDDIDDHADEEPQVVVLKEGDLTAEEVSKVKLEKEEGKLTHELLIEISSSQQYFNILLYVLFLFSTPGPADLTQRVVFRKPDKAKKDVIDSSDPSETDLEESKNSKKVLKKEHSKSSSRSKDSKDQSKTKALLSFNEDDETEEF